MGFTEVLTIVFIALKLLAVIDWSWWLVLLPEIVACALYFSIVVIYAISITQKTRMIKKHYKRYWGF